jgi:hypothetical protein
MYNGIMNAESEIDWIQKEVLDQVDGVVENFTLLESGEKPLLEFSKVVVASILGKIDVAHALNIYRHLHKAGKLDDLDTKDRIQCLYDHFNDWIELELAKRYA